MQHMLCVYNNACVYYKIHAYINRNTYITQGIFKLLTFSFMKVAISVRLQSGHKFAPCHNDAIAL